MSLLICPDCGKIISAQFSIHHCNGENVSSMGRIERCARGEREFGKRQKCPLSPSVPTPFEAEYPDAAQYLMKLYEDKPKHLIILETPWGFRLHMCYFPNEQIHV